MLRTVCGLPINWSATGDMLSGIGTVAGAIAIVLAAKMGAVTYENWKLQRLYERQVELAEAALTLAYKMQDAISVIRNPFSSEKDHAAAVDELKAAGFVINETEDNWWQLQISQIIINRINNYSELYEELAQIRPRVRAVFGKQVEGKLAVFHWAIDEVRRAAFSYARASRTRPRTEPQQQRLDAQMERYEGTFWEGRAPEYDENDVPREDSIKRAVADAVQELESSFKELFDATSRTSQSSVRYRLWSRTAPTE